MEELLSIFQEVEDPRRGTRSATICKERPAGAPCPPPPLDAKCEATAGRDDGVSRRRAVASPSAFDTRRYSK